MTRDRRTAWQTAGIVCAAAAVLWSSSAAALPSGIEAVAITQLAVDGLPPGALHRVLGAGGIDANGPYFLSIFDDASGMHPAIFATDASGQRFEKLRSEPFNGPFGFGEFAMSRRGQLLFEGNIPFVTGLALFRENLLSESFDLVAEMGSAAPSSRPGAVYADLAPFTITGTTGEVSFGRTLEQGLGGVESPAIWWTLPSGIVEPLLEIGDAVPGPPMIANNSVLVTASEAGAVVNAGGLGFYFVPFMGGVSYVGAVTGPLPDDPAETFINVKFPRLNDAGEVAFAAQGETSGWLLYGPDGLGGSVRWVSQGDPAIAVGVGATFDSFAGVLGAQSVHLNNAGRILFNAKVNGLDSLWIADGPGDLRLIALQGAPLALRNPEFLPSQAPYECAPQFGVAAALNDFGDAMFKCQIRTGAGQPSFDAIFVEQAGVLTLVAREGQDYELEPGVIGTIDTIEFREDEVFGVSRPTSGFGDAGLVFNAVFSVNGMIAAREAVLHVPNATLVPEPGRLMLTIAALLTLGGLGLHRGKTPERVEHYARLRRPNLPLG